jgi:hypothetical protein
MDFEAARIEADSNPRATISDDVSLPTKPYEDLTGLANDPSFGFGFIDRFGRAPR